MQSDKEQSVKELAKVIAQIIIMPEEWGRICTHEGNYMCELDDLDEFEYQLGKMVEANLYSLIPLMITTKVERRNVGEVHFKAMKRMLSRLINEENVMTWIEELYKAINEVREERQKEIK